MSFINNQQVKQLLGEKKKRINGDLFKQAEWLFLQYLIPLAQLLENVYTLLCVAGLAC